ncbi:MAG: hypothetical protein ACP5H2_11855 [Solirubrobacteraceae bacterium]
MSIESVLADRYRLWFRLLCEDFGYEEQPPRQGPRSRNELVLRAVRPGFAPVEPVSVEIREAWQLGRDPELGTDAQGCFLVSASWHAQIVGRQGDEGGERLDVDRTHRRELWIRRHPLGEPNDVRLPASRLKHPNAWLQHLEEVIAEHYGDWFRDDA